MELSYRDERCDASYSSFIPFCFHENRFSSLLFSHSHEKGDARPRIGGPTLATNATEAEAPSVAMTLVATVRGFPRRMEGAV